MSYLTDLVWVGNTIVPRWVPLASLVIGVMFIAGGIWLIRKLVAGLT